MPSLDSLKSLKTLEVSNKTYHYFCLPDAARTLGNPDKQPLSLKVPLDILLRWDVNHTVTCDDLKALAGWSTERKSHREH